MVIQVNANLKRTLIPKEHNVSITNKYGDIIQIVGDGYNLVEFHKIEVIQKVTTKDRKRIFVKRKLQWHVHDIDFSIAENQNPNV